MTETDPTFAMRLRTGNWDTALLLPFHKPVTVTLAPSAELDKLVTLDSPTAAIPSALARADIDSLSIADTGGRVVLRLDVRSGDIERHDSTRLATATSWELRIESRHGVLILYSRDEGRPGERTLDGLVARFGALAA